MQDSARAAQPARQDHTGHPRHQDKGTSRGPGDDAASHRAARNRCCSGGGSVGPVHRRSHSWRQTRTRSSASGVGIMEALAHKRQPVRRKIGSLIFIVAVMGRSTLYAQAPTPVQTPTPVLTAAVPREPAPPVEQSADAVRLLVGRSTIVNVGKPIARVSLTSADIADALVTAPNELLINGKAAGTISMFVWDRAGVVRRYEVVVQRDLARLEAQFKELFPKESITVRANGKTAVLSGNVSSKDVADKMASLAGSFVDSKEELVSLLQVGEAGRSNQVLLRVRFAEVSRSAMSDLGVSLFTSPT